MPIMDRTVTCGLFGHTLAEYIAAHGEDENRMQNYQMELYNLVDIQIKAGMRRFVVLLQPGAALWMAEYLIWQMKAMPWMGMELHVIAQREPTSEDLPLVKTVFAEASSKQYDQSQNRVHQFRTLMEQCERILFIERFEGHDVLRSYAESEGITVIRHVMPLGGLPCHRTAADDQLS